jgi:holliday junction DNA helicase RuvA
LFGGLALIAFVSGPVAALLPDIAVIEVGGVGLSVQCTPVTLSRLQVGEPAVLFTSLIVREDSLTLYGFTEADERTVFELLQIAGGIGPRLAQAMLAVHSPDALRRAVAEGDVTALIRVPGIGRKGAQRIILELKDRLGSIALAGPVPVGGAGLPMQTGVHHWRDQVHSALLGLGWSAREADEAVAVVAPDAEAASAAGRTPDVGGLLKAALRTLSRS